MVAGSILATDGKPGCALVAKENSVESHLSIARGFIQHINNYIYIGYAVNSVMADVRIFIAVAEKIISAVANYHLIMTYDIRLVLPWTQFKIRTVRIVYKRYFLPSSIASFKVSITIIICLFPL